MREQGTPPELGTRPNCWVGMWYPDPQIWSKNVVLELLYHFKSFSETLYSIPEKIPERVQCDTWFQNST